MALNYQRHIQQSNYTNSNPSNSSHLPAINNMNNSSHLPAISNGHKLFEYTVDTQQIEQSTQFPFDTLLSDDIFLYSKSPNITTSSVSPSYNTGITPSPFYQQTAVQQNFDHQALTQNRENNGYLQFSQLLPPKSTTNTNNWYTHDIQSDHDNNTFLGDSASNTTNDEEEEKENKTIQEFIQYIIEENKCDSKDEFIFSLDSINTIKSAKYLPKYYEKGAEIERGSDGIVFAVKYQDVVIKQIHVKDVYKSIGSSLQELSIWRIHDIFYDFDHDILYKVYPKYDKDLFEIITTPGTVYNEADVIKLALDTSYQLKTVHDKGYIHCDLKPENIMTMKITGDDDKAIIIDWERARFCMKGSKIMVPFTGTKGWAAPEFKHNAENSIDHKADVFSLGLVLIWTLNKGSFGDIDISNNTFGDIDEEQGVFIVFLEILQELKDKAVISTNIYYLLIKMLQNDAEKRISIVEVIQSLESYVIDINKETSEEIWNNDGYKMYYDYNDLSDRVRKSETNFIIHEKHEKCLGIRCIHNSNDSDKFDDDLLCNSIPFEEEQYAKSFNIDITMNEIYDIEGMDKEEIAHEDDSSDN